TNLDSHAGLGGQAPPCASHDAVDDYRARQETAQGKYFQPNRAAGVDDRRPVSITHGVLVEIGQQVRSPRDPGRAAWSSAEPVVLALENLVLERRTGEADSQAGVGHRQA